MGRCKSLYPCKTLFDRRSWLARQISVNRNEAMQHRRILPQCPNLNQTLQVTPARSKLEKSSDLLQSHFHAVTFDRVTDSIVATGQLALLIIYDAVLVLAKLIPMQRIAPATPFASDVSKAPKINSLPPHISTFFTILKT